jgi:cyanophycinase
MRAKPAVLILSLLGCVGEVRAEPVARGDGSLFLIGGALEDPSIFREIVGRAGGVGRAKIGIVSEASRRYAQESAQEAMAQFRRHGAADARRVELDERTGELRDPSQLRGLTCLFFTGGDQDRLRAILRPYGGKSAGFRAIERARHRGLVIAAGTSAGAAVQVGPNMIIGGESYEAFRGKAQHPSDQLSFKRSDRPGFGFFPYGVVDTHCSARGREGRMTVLAAATRQRLAFGIGENTALVVGPEREGQVEMKVIGKNGVSIVDLSGAASRQQPSGGRWKIGNLRFSYLTDGDRLGLQQNGVGWSVGRFEIAPSKQPVTASLAGEPPAVDDVFSSYRNHRQERQAAGLRGRHRARAFVETAQRLFCYQACSTVAGAFEDRGRTDAPVLQVSFHKQPDARAFGPPAQRSVTNLRVDLGWKRKQPQPRRR